MPSKESPCNANDTLAASKRSKIKNPNLFFFNKYKSQNEMDVSLKLRKVLDYGYFKKVVNL